MPDFEALIKHQQLKQPTANQRLKIVTDSNNQDKISDEKKGNLILLTYFTVGLVGALIGAISILLLSTRFRKSSKPPGWFPLWSNTKIEN